MNQNTVAAGKFFSRMGLILVTILVIAGTQALAQQKTIRGTVTGTSGNNGPLPDISVVVKGTSRGTTTNAQGQFSIMAAENETLVFSAVGFQSQEIRVGRKETINIQLQPADDQLEGVVVTALGIRREEKALGYASQKIGTEDVNDARANNFVNALSGKVAGLTLISPGSGPVNSVRISLRGNTSLNPDGNNALVVVDGVPMNSNLTGSGVSSAYGAGSGNDVPIDFGNGIADINPDDIESITVLKGASATALYGSRAANGALLITTKSGSRKTKGIGVTVNSNFTLDDVLHWPDFQHEYGQGTGRAFNTNGELYYSYRPSADGANTGGTSSAFGPKFDGQMYFQFDPETEGQSPERRLWRPYTDNVKGFFRTGYTLTNNVSMEGGNDKGSVRVSVTHSKNEWIMPNTGYERLSGALSVNYNISDKLRISSKVNFTNKKSDNLPATGYNNQSISYFIIFQNPNVDLNWYRPIWAKGQTNVQQLHPFSSFIDNPFLIAYEMTNGVNSYTTVGNLQATYEFSKKFDVLLRTAVNMNSEQREQQRPYSTANFARGYYRQQNINFIENNTDALLSYHENVGSDIKLNASVGGNSMHRKYRLVNGTVDGLVIPGIYKLSNGISSPIMNVNNANKIINSVYGFVNLAWREKIFLDITGRNDWSSTLPKQNYSFFYPSVSTSFILSDMLQLPRQVSFAKLRLSAAQVGNDTEPYQTSKYYSASDFAGSGSVPTTLYNTDFKPEITTSYEAGLNVNLFNNRFGFDVTYYRAFTKNQIVKVPLDYVTGYNGVILNSGKVRNAGVELVVNAKPVKTRDFTWATVITWSKNENKILSLAEGFDDKQPIGSGGTADIIATVGGTTGDIYGFGFVRSPDGQIVFNASTGLPERPSDIQYIGNAYADWRGGINNEFTYKNFRFSFLIDGQYGGIVYSQTHHKMTEQGKLKHTLRGREEGYIIGDGVNNDNGTFKKNTTQVSLPDYYRDFYRRANVESNSFDASYLKLREIRLEYKLPKKLLDKIKINQATVALYGRNLAMLTSFPAFDPESAALNGSTILPGVEIGQLPTTRTMGINLTFKF